MKPHCHICFGRHYTYHHKPDHCAVCGSLDHRTSACPRYEKAMSAMCDPDDHRKPARGDGMCYRCGVRPKGSSGRCTICNRAYQKELYWRRKREGISGKRRRGAYQKA